MFNLQSISLSVTLFFILIAGGATIANSKLHQSKQALGVNKSKQIVLLQHLNDFYQQSGLVNQHFFSGKPIDSVALNNLIYSFDQFLNLIQVEDLSSEEQLETTKLENQFRLFVDDIKNTNHVRVKLSKRFLVYQDHVVIINQKLSVLFDRTIVSIENQNEALQKEMHTVQKLLVFIAVLSVFAGVFVLVFFTSVFYRQYRDKPNLPNS